MSNELSWVAVHVSNFWQTCEWYHLVFGFTIEIIPSGSTAYLEVAGKTLAFTSHQNEEYSLGLRRRNSFLTHPPAFNLDISTSDVQALFTHALACGAVPVLEPALDACDQLQASIRDLRAVSGSVYSFHARDRDAIFCVSSLNGSQWYRRAISFNDETQNIASLPRVH